MARRLGEPSWGTTMRLHLQSCDKKHHAECTKKDAELSKAVALAQLFEWFTQEPKRKKE